MNDAYLTHDAMGYRGTPGHWPGAAPLEATTSTGAGGDVRELDWRGPDDGDELVSPLSPLSSIVVGLDGDGEPGWLTYPAYAVLHPANLGVLAFLAALALFMGSLGLLLAAVAFAAVLVGGVARLPAFRRRVDRRVDELEAAKAAEQREADLARMSASHAREVHALEALIARSRGSAARRGAGERALAAPQLDVDRMVAAYVRLAITHRALSDVLVTNYRPDLEAELERLSAAVGGDVAPALAHLIDQRARLVRLRLEHVRRVEEAVKAAAEQLATIAETVELIAARTISPVGEAVTAPELEPSLEALEAAEEAVAELSAPAALPER